MRKSMKSGRLTDEELDRKFNGNRMEEGGKISQPRHILLTHHGFTEKQLSPEKSVLTVPNLPVEQDAVEKKKMREYTRLTTHALQSRKR